MSVSFTDYLAAVRARVSEIEATGPGGLVALQLAEPDLVLLDVREPDEHAAGLIEGAIAVPRGLLEQRVEALVPDRGRRVVVYCAGGTRSVLAADTLRQLGYDQVASLAGGVGAWLRAGLPLAQPVGLDDAQRRRYARQIAMPQVGEAGQAKLLDARVLIVGAGGLGSPTALYLAAAGVGTLGIVDDDRVDLSNLQRQILHDETWLGRPKVASARDRLARLNPGVTVHAHELRLSAANVAALVADYDVIVDGTDNFATRYLINDACVLAGKPNVHGAIHHFDGQVAVFCHGGGPCYRCLYPAPPPAGQAPSCAEAGVIGAICGVIGSLQAVEVVKVLLGVGDTLSGRLLSVDLLYGQVRELRVRRNPACPACGAVPSITAPVDLEAGCAGPAATSL